VITSVRIAVLKGFGIPSYKDTDIGSMVKGIISRLIVNY
jgi:hypothetical protein